MTVAPAATSAAVANSASQSAPVQPPSYTTHNLSMVAAAQIVQLVTSVTKKNFKTVVSDLKEVSWFSEVLHNLRVEVVRFFGPPAYYSLFCTLVARTNFKEPQQKDQVFDAAQCEVLTCLFAA